MDKLGIDPKLLVAQTINFLIVLFVYIRFVHKPFIRSLNQEKKKKQELEGALSKIQKEQEAVQKQKEMLEIELESRTKKAYNKLKGEADAMKQAAIKEAQEEAQRIREQNTQIIERDREKMVEDVKGQGVSIATAVLEKALVGLTEGELSKKVTRAVIEKLPRIQNE